MDSHDVTAPPVDNARPGEKSEAQRLLERMLTQCNRFNGIRRKLDVVRGSIAPARPRAGVVAAPARGNPSPATTFFEALHMLADGNDIVADELERSVDDLGRLF